eukprot:1398739-Pyramimonas_sp.AAC.1
MTLWATIPWNVELLWPSPQPLQRFPTEGGLPAGSWAHPNPVRAGASSSERSPPSLELGGPRPSTRHLPP